MPKKVDPAAQRRRITQAAIRVIDRSGLEGARLRDVARAADATTGAVMHYFDGKDAVLEAALEEVVRCTLERMETGVEPETRGDVPIFIGRVCRYLPVDEASRRDWRVWLAFWGRAMADDRLRSIHQRYYAAIIETMAETLRPLAGGTPAPPKKRRREIADAMLAAIDGVGTRATLDPEHWPPRRQRETLSVLLRPMLDDFCRETGTSPRSAKRRKKERES